MLIELGGSPNDIRKISSTTELERYFRDFGYYNVALDVTTPEKAAMIVHATAHELFEALQRLVETGTALTQAPGDAEAGARILYLHSFSPAEANQILVDEEYATIQFDIMRLRASVLGLLPKPSGAGATKRVQSAAPTKGAAAAAPPSPSPRGEAAARRKAHHKS